jgi:HK97 family phage major capsid protein
VPEEFGTDLIDLREQYSVFRRNAKIVPMATDTRTDPRRTGGLTAYFTGESDAITESNKTWDRVSLTAKKLSVLARMTSELSEDSAISIADDLAGEIAYAFGKKEDECGFVGTGSSTYGGIVGATEALKGLSGTIAHIAGLKVGTGNAYSELTLNDFIGTVAKLPEFADMNAKWYVHKLFYHDVMVRAMLAAGGVTAAEIESARNKTFLGYPVEFTQVMPKVEANSQVCALFGDLAMAASMGVRRDTTIALSEHSRFANDEIEIRGTERFDINVHSVGNASATAADREAGALVGLITAAA